MAKPKTGSARTARPKAPAASGRTTASAGTGANPAPARKVPAQSKVLADSLGVTLEPIMDGKEVQRLLKPLPGYINLLDDVAKKLPADVEALNLKQIDPKALTDLKTRHEELSEKEHVIGTVYFSVRQQRMKVDDEGMRYLRLINRRVNTRQEEDPDLYARWKPLREYLSAFHGGPSGAAGDDGGTVDEGEGEGSATG